MLVERNKNYCMKLNATCTTTLNNIVYEINEQNKQLKSKTSIKEVQTF